MHTETQKALRKLAGENKPALKLALKFARELHYRVHTWGTAQTLFCTEHGTYYVACQSEDPCHVRILAVQPTDFDVMIGPEYADSDEGYASFGDIPEEMWEGLAEDIQHNAEELAS